MIQIMLLWDMSNPDDEEMVDKLIKGFKKMGCWSVELPPQGSIYKRMVTIEQNNIEKYKEEQQNGKKGKGNNV